MREAYCLKTEALLAALETGRRGLSGREAAGRLEKFGPNELDSAREKPGWRRFLEQLRDPMILVLLAAAGLSFLTSGGEDFIDAVMILGIVLVNAVISISQEEGAARALAALQAMAAPLARALRDGAMVRLPTAELVPGDVIFLEAGDLVPADGRILECAGLKLDESAMTGESGAIAKEAVESLPRGTALGDRKNMLLSATVVLAGRCVLLVTATGMDSELGHIAGLLTGAEETVTPLQRKMGEISKTLSFACLGACGVMFGIGLLQGRPLPGMFLTAVSLAVAAIPEGLTAIVTIALALGVQRMAKRNAIVKKLPAVETLGCAGVICSDKTGTLTQNKMAVAEVWSRGNRHGEAVLTIGALCGDAVLLPGGREARGDPTEAALLLCAARDGRWAAGEPARVGEVPFDAVRKRMCTVHKRREGGWRVLVKGAPDLLLGCCDRVLGEGVTALSPGLRAEILAANEIMADRALRVLGTAYKDVDTLPPMEAEALETGLIFVGLAGLLDPPRPEAKRAVEQCYAAGIRPVMITGDHKLTAVAIARELGIYRAGDRALTGADLDFMPPEMLEAEVERFAVYARVTPEHKMRIVQAWQKRGRVVAMTGDGVNDAPALKAADIGCAMGRAGTDVAKGAADLILTDDNFASIVAAVGEGRGIYANIKKAVHYLLSCNIGELLTIFVATLLDFGQMPLIPVQLLWLNLVTDSLPALALGVEPVEPGVMEEAPRGAAEPLFSKAFSLRLLWQGVMVGALTLGAYLLGKLVLSAPGTEDAVANTMAFATLTLCQLFHAYDVRSEEKSLWSIGLFRNRAMNRAFLIGLGMQLAVLCLPPLQAVFSTVAMSGAQWGTVAALAVAPVVICEGEKRWRLRIGG